MAQTTQASIQTDLIIIDEMIAYVIATNAFQPFIAATKWRHFASKTTRAACYWTFFLFNKQLVGNFHSNHNSDRFYEIIKSKQQTAINEIYIIWTIALN